MNFIPSARKRYNRCERKKPLTQQQATLLAKRIQERPNRPKDARMIPYQCYYGDHWHVGHARPESRTWREFKEAQAAR